MTFIRTVTVGSILHQMNTPASDHDIAVIHIADTIALAMDPTLAKTVHFHVPEDGDTTSYEFGTLATLASKGNPTAIEALASNLIISQQPGRLNDLLDNLKETILTHLPRYRFKQASLGYSLSSYSQAAAGKRIDKNLRMACYIQRQAIHYLQEGEYTFDHGQDLLGLTTYELSAEFSRVSAILESIELPEEDPTTLNQEVHDIVYEARSVVFHRSQAPE